MDKLYEELFRSMNQFRKLKFSEMFPEVCKTDYFVLCTIMDKGENGQITISELAARAASGNFQNVKRVRGAWIRGAECQQK